METALAIGHVPRLVRRECQRYARSSAPVLATWMLLAVVGFTASTHRRIVSQ